MRVILNIICLPVNPVRYFYDVCAGKQRTITSRHCVIQKWNESIDLQIAVLNIQFHLTTTQTVLYTEERWHQTIPSHFRFLLSGKHHPRAKLRKTTSLERHPQPKHNVEQLLFFFKVFSRSGRLWRSLTSSLVIHISEDQTCCDDILRVDWWK